MQYKTKLMLLLGVGLTILIVTFLAYSRYLFYPNLFLNQKESLEKTDNIVVLTLKNTLKNGSSNESSKFSPIFTDIKNSALNKYLSLNEDNAPLDYVAFYYYSKSSNNEQFFETSVYNEDVKPDYKGEDCYKVLRVPDNEKAEVENYLKKAYINLDNFVCRMEDHKSFVGFVIDKDPVKKYLYFRTLNDNDVYKTPDYNKVIAGLDLSSILKKDTEYRLSILDKNRNIVLSNSDDKNTSEIEDEYFTLAHNEGHIFVDSANGNTRILSLTYLKEFDLYLSLSEEKGLAVKPFVTFSIIMIILYILLFAIGIYLIELFFRKFDKDTRNIQNTEELITGQLFSDQNKAEESIQNFSKENIKCAILYPVTEIIRTNYLKLIENVNNKLNSLNEEHKQELMEIAKQSKNLVVSSLHASLMPVNSDMPRSKNLDIASFIQPSAENPSDFYDIFRVDKDNICVVFGSCEPCGETVINPINLCTNYLKNAITNENKLPGYALTCLNKMLQLKDRGELKIELFVVILSEFTGNFIYSSCGGLSPIHVQSQSKYELLNKEHKQPPLYSHKEYTYADSKGKFQINDTLLFAGHGIDKVMNKEQQVFGMERVIDVAQKSHLNSASEQLISLYKASKEFSNEPEGTRDICAILIKRYDPKKVAEEAAAKEQNV